MQWFRDWLRHTLLSRLELLCTVSEQVLLYVVFHSFWVFLDGQVLLLRKKHTYSNAAQQSVRANNRWCNTSAVYLKTQECAFKGAGFT